MREGEEEEQANPAPESANSDEQGVSSPATIGYGKPPLSTRFPKGKSGNPRGRPKGSKTEGLPYEAILGRKVPINDRGVEREVTTAEAFLLKMVKQCLSGNPRQTKLALVAVREARQYALKENPPEYYFHISVVDKGSLAGAAEHLGMATVLDRFSPGARLALDPWLVQAALKRSPELRLTSDEQRVVLNATHHPRKVKWPDWWEVFAPERRKKSGTSAPDLE